MDWILLSATEFYWAPSAFKPVYRDMWKRRIRILSPLPIAMKGLVGVGGGL